MLHHEAKAFMKGERLDGGQPVLEYVPAVGEQKERIIIEGD